MRDVLDLDNEKEIHCKNFFWKIYQKISERIKARNLLNKFFGFLVSLLLYLGKRSHDWPVATNGRRCRLR